MKTVRLNVLDRIGLHTRTATAIARAAACFEADIWVTNTNGKRADAKSPLALMTLGVKHGGEIELGAQGADADAAIDKLCTLIREF